MIYVYMEFTNSVRELKVHRRQHDKDYMIRHLDEYNRINARNKGEPSMFHLSLPKVDVQAYMDHASPDVQIALIGSDVPLDTSQRAALLEKDDDQEAIHDAMNKRYQKHIDHLEDVGRRWNSPSVGHLGETLESYLEHDIPAIRAAAILLITRTNRQLTEEQEHILNNDPAQEVKDAMEYRKTNQAMNKTEEYNYAHLGFNR